MTTSHDTAPRSASMVTGLEQQIEVIREGHWEERRLRNPFFLCAVFTNVPRSQLHGVVKSTQVTIPFVSHAWSGIAEIYVDGAHHGTLDLYSPRPSYISYRIEFPDAAEHRFTVALSDKKNFMSHSTELFVGPIYADYLTPPMLHAGERRLFPLTKFLSFIDGTHGSFVVMNNDIYLSRGIISEGQWGAEAEPVFRRFITTGSVVFDVGANIGGHSVLFSRLAGESGRVHAFEPQRALYYVLCANLVVNDCPNVGATHAAVGALDGAIDVPAWGLADERNISGTALDAQSASEPKQTVGIERVRLVSLDTYARNCAIDRLDFIKADVQGFELFVLQGAMQVLSNFHPVLNLEISPHLMRANGYSCLDIYRLLQGAGYELFDIEMRPLNMGWKEEERFYTEKLEWDIVAMPRSGKV